MPNQVFPIRSSFLIRSHYEKVFGTPHRGNYRHPTVGITDPTEGIRGPPLGELAIDKSNVGFISKQK